MKTSLFCSLFLLVAGLQAQILFTSNFSNWGGNPLLPTDWVGSKTNQDADSIKQISTGTVYGPFAVQLIKVQNSHKRFTTTPVSVTKGEVYLVEFWAKGKGDIRTGIFDDRTTGFGYFYNSYISLNTPTWTKYTQSITADSTVNYAEFIISIKATSAADGHIQIDSVCIKSASIPVVSIYDIQYTSNQNGDSPYKNQKVTTTGVVTGAHAAGYFIQQGSGAWNGVYVFDNTNTPAVGDSIVLTATVLEYFNMTQLSSVDSYTKISSGNTLPTPAVISSADVNTEDYEGVLVRVNMAFCITPNAGFGMWTVTTAGMQDTCKIHNLLYTYPNPLPGEIYNITGPVYYAYAEYRIEPRNINDVEWVSGISASNLNASTVKIYPNPANEFITIDGTFTGNEAIQIHSLQGRMLLQTKLSGVQTSIQFDVSALPAGMYMLHIIGNEGAISKKWVKK